MLGKLRNVHCARCLTAGHKCQAQIVIDEIPLCLRCADDEPCIYTIVEAKKPPLKVCSDPYTIPLLSAEDRQALREMPKLSSIYATTLEAGRRLQVDESLRATVAQLANDFTCNEIAYKFRVSVGTIRNVLRTYRKKLWQDSQNKV